MRARNPRRIVMLGTSFETHGGISSVVNAYRAGGLFARWPITYVQTHCDGSRFSKWSCAIGAFFSMLFLIARHPGAVATRRLPGSVNRLPRSSSRRGTSGTNSKA